MIFKFLLLIFFPFSAFASFDFEGDLLATHRSLNSEDYWVGGEVEFRTKYLINEKRDDFGLLISPPDKIILDIRGQFNYQDKLENAFNLSIRNFGFEKQLGQYGKLYIGDRILIWGKADKINPIDVWNAEDLKFFLDRDKKNRKKPRTMFVYDWIKQNTHLQIVVALNDVRSYTQLAPNNSSWCGTHCQLFSEENIRAQLTGLGAVANFKPFQTNNLPDIGLRYSQAIGGHDYSLVLYHGADRFPYYSRDIRSLTNFVFTPYQERQTIIGGDYSKSIGKYTLFFEGKYQIQRPYFLNPNSQAYLTDDDGLIFDDELSLIFGIDRTLGYGIYFNLQLFHLHRSNDLDDTYSFGGERLAIALISKELSEKIKLEYTFIGDTQFGDYSNSIKFQYNKSDEQSFEIGYRDFHNNNELSLFAGFDNQQNLFLNLRQSF